MLPVIWSPAARADLKAIVEYIAERNPLAASGLHCTLINAAKRLPLQPLLYRAGRLANTRELTVHPNYILIYRVEKAAIRVLSVLHTRQRYP
nr:type II toxin-antitoxin system RelE/ParE family toxin [uncultured Duganella sp.]